MKKLMSVSLFVFVCVNLFSVAAHAANVELKDAAAESFITRHFPDADVPGPVEGFFNYKNKRGVEKEGYAKCFYPAMGGRSDGAVTTCSVNYLPVVLTDAAAESFITRHFPDAEIPGPVAGAFTYVNKRGMKKIGNAKCFYPAMGGRSNGDVTTCSVVY